MAFGAPCGVPQAFLPLRVTSTSEASRLVRARGGTLYVTLADGGARVSTAAPDEALDVDGVDAGGYLLVYDRRLAWPAELHVAVAAGEPAARAAGPPWHAGGRTVWW